MIKKIIKKDFFSPFIWPKTLKIIRKFCFKKNLRYFGMFFLKKDAQILQKKFVKFQRNLVYILKILKIYFWQEKYIIHL